MFADALGVGGGRTDARAWFSQPGAEETEERFRAFDLMRKGSQYILDPGHIFSNPPYCTALTYLGTT